MGETQKEKKLECCLVSVAKMVADGEGWHGTGKQPVRYGGGFPYFIANSTRIQDHNQHERLSTVH